MKFATLLHVLSSPYFYTSISLGAFFVASLLWHSQVFSFTCLPFELIFMFTSSFCFEEKKTTTKQQQQQKKKKKKKKNK